MLSALPGHRTFWNDLKEWFDMEFVGGEYGHLAEIAERASWVEADAKEVPLLIRNASWFQPIRSIVPLPTISLLQDIFEEGPAREMQEAVIRSSHATVFNSMFTADKYSKFYGDSALRALSHVFPLPVDFSVFAPGNAMGLQQALSLPDGCICWIGASQGAAGQVKGWDILLQIARLNPDLSFVAVFKDAAPPYVPPNMRTYVRLSQEELAKVIGACRVGMCTSRMESQHLAGIEMGACGLPMVAPEVGIYWKRNFPGVPISDEGSYSAAIRGTLPRYFPPDVVREYWRKEFDREIIREKWTALIAEVECSGAS
jgi:hypothetical protein